jgi:hypothetical protein
MEEKVRRGRSLSQKPPMYLQELMKKLLLNDEELDDVVRASTSFIIFSTT